MATEQKEAAELSRVVDDVHQMLLRFERTMGVGHKVMIGFLVTQVALLVAMTVGIWRRR